MGDGTASTVLDKLKVFLLETGNEAMQRIGYGDIDMSFGRDLRRNARRADGQHNGESGTHDGGGGESGEGACSEPEVAECCRQDVPHSASLRHVALKVQINRALHNASRNRLIDLVKPRARLRPDDGANLNDWALCTIKAWELLAPGTRNDTKANTLTSGNSGPAWWRCWRRVRVSEFWMQAAAPDS